MRYYSKSEPLQVENFKVVCVALISTSRGVSIGVQGGFTDLVKSATLQVVASRPAMEFGLHQPSAWDSPLPPLGDCHHEANPREAARWGRSAGHPLGPLVNDLCTLPPHVRYTPRVTLILVEFQIPL
jgi:hypothetical protein